MLLSTFHKMYLCPRESFSSGYKGSGGGKQSSNPMTMKDAARIQSATARANGGIVPAGSFAARAQAAAAKNVRDGIVPDEPSDHQWSPVQRYQETYCTSQDPYLVDDYDDYDDDD